jgi:hypothetical protein
MRHILRRRVALSILGSIVFAVVATGQNAPDERRGGGRGGSTFRFQKTPLPGFFEL